MKRIYLKLKKRNPIQVLSIAILVLALSFQSHAQTLLDVMPNGKFFGTIMSDGFASGGGGTQRTIVPAQFNAMVMENGMKMGSVFKSGYNVSKFPAVDESDLNLVPTKNFIAYCNENGMRKRGHTLLWYSQAPNFLNTLKPSGADINTFMENFITVYLNADGIKDEIDEWDVANEMLSNSGSGYRTLGDDNSTPVWFTNIAGTGQAGTAAYNTALDNLMANCFKWTRAVAAPNAKLFYNDYSIEGLGWSKATSAYNLVDRLIGLGAPIDGIGFQTHFSVGNFIPTSQVPSVVNNIKKFATLESVALKPIEVAITEFDIRAGSTTAMTAQQKNDAYYDMVSTTLAEPNCNSFITWGISECCSWIPSTFSGQVPFLLYDASYNQNGTPTTEGAWAGTYNALSELKVLLGVDDFGYKKKTVTVLPNPATNNITVSGLTSSDKSFEVTDILGKRILKRTVVSDSDTSIDVSQLQSGFYFLKTLSGKSAKIIKN
jgi:GH35 family endo-1,4-beta-xylanase